MNKISHLFFILVLVFAVSCNKSDDDTTEPRRDYTEQYAADLDTIDEFIDTHFMTVSADYDVTFTKITAQTPGTTIRAQTEYPLQFKMVTNSDHNVDYKVYYIKLREGANKTPTAVDSVHTAYRGTLISNSQFTLAQTPEWLTLDTTVKGWPEIVTLFKTGFYDTGGGPNPVNFTDYGAGVMFLPSGLAYYNEVRSGIPKYSPLIFGFKLFELRYRDHDRDGILSKNEVAVAGDDPMDYDSDGDGTANMIDIDDDGDHILTRNEVVKDEFTGEVTFPDCDGDGTPNYLDADSMVLPCP